jgi:predicted DNA-binding protein
MDKLLSARVDETVIRRIGSLARQLGTTKKTVIEGAILFYAEKLKNGTKADVLERTCSSQKRTESTAKTVTKARQVLRRSVKKRRAK